MSLKKPALISMVKRVKRLCAKLSNLCNSTFAGIRLTGGGVSSASSSSGNADAAADDERAS